MQKKYFYYPSRQNGIALYTIIIFVLLTMLLALWASRTAIFNELLVSNDADYQRAFEASQALIQDAELDIRGEQSNGSVCQDDGSDDKICRRNSSITRFPNEQKEVGPLVTMLDRETYKCSYAICVKRTGKQDFWNNTDSTQGPTLAQLAVNNIGARYGQYTGAKTGAASNPILADRSSATAGGWYWIEIMPYDANASNSGLVSNGSTNLGLNLSPNVVYRITALAYGRKANSVVVVQQTYAQQRRKD